MVFNSMHANFHEYTLYDLHMTLNMLCRGYVCSSLEMMAYFQNVRLRQPFLQILLYLYECSLNLEKVTTIFTTRRNIARTLHETKPQPVWFIKDKGGIIYYLCLSFSGHVFIELLHQNAHYRHATFNNNRNPIKYSWIQSKYLDWYKTLNNSLMIYKIQWTSHKACSGVISLSNGHRSL